MRYLPLLPSEPCARFPWPVIFVVLAATGFLGYQARRFRLDASAETLVLENDKDLNYARVIDSRYGSDDFLVVTYTPRNDLLAADTLMHLRRLRDELTAIDRVSSVRSILDVPLLASPPVPLKEIAAREGAKRIRSETDKRVSQALDEANRRADQAVAEAKKQEAALIKEAATRSEQATDQIEKQTGDRIR